MTCTISHVLMVLLFLKQWWTAGLNNISGHAKNKAVTPMAWLHARDFYDAKSRRQKLDEMVAAGIRGVKVDFWCSDRQETIAAIHALFEDAAARQLIVNLHGCTLPRGWQRTWPNFLTAEAVLGAESYFYESRYTERAAELNTVLPFTRNAVGPMDYTPVACSPKKFIRTTTAAHELATALIFTSGLIHYADKAEFFESLPNEVLQVFRDAPARWDETRCLLGEPGRVAVFARRSGASWFIAGINGTGEPLPVSPDLSAFATHPKRLLIAEGTNATMEVASLRSRRQTNGGTRFRRAAALSCEWMNELRRPNDEGTIMRGNRTAYRIATGHHEQIRRRGNDQSAGVGSVAHGRTVQLHLSWPCRNAVRSRATQGVSRSASSVS